MIQLLFISLFSFSAIAQSQIYLQYCFEDRMKASSALKRIQFLKTANDYIGQDGPCLDVTTSQSRQELYNKVIRTKFGITSSSLSSANNQGLESQCHFTVTRIKSNNLSSIGAAANLKNIGARQSQHKGKSQTISTLVVSQGKPASLTVREQNLSLTCHITAAGYNVDIAIQGNESSLKTSRFITKGASIELGSISQSLNATNKNADLNQGINHHDQNKNENEKVYLSIK